MKPNRAFVPSLLIAAIVIIAANAWIAFRAVNSLVRSEYWVEHTWQALDETERIMGSAKDAETGNRGYLITGDERYLAPYLSAKSELPDELDRLQSLTSDSPVEQASVAEMREAVRLRLATLGQGVMMRRSGNASSSQAILQAGTGKAEMDHLRGVADRMESEEHRLLAIRTATAQSSATKSRSTIALATGLDFLLIVFMYRYFVRERRLRIASDLANGRLAIARSEAEERSREIHSLNATLEERVKLRTSELETTNRELEAFSYSVSHDLRAPLRTIDGFSLALEEDYEPKLDDVGRDYIRRVRGGVQRMGELIDALLQLSRITRAEIVREDFDMSQLAESVAGGLMEQNNDRDLRFEIEPGRKAFADPKLVRVTLENLLGNAVKFSSKTPAATVSFGWDLEQKAWYVRDNGAGFDMFYADRLFNAFNRLHGDKDFKGSGIGLATVARIVHRHHGRIWAEGAVNHGATFWFTLG